MELIYDQTACFADYFLFTFPAWAAEYPPVNKSSTGICHAKGLSYYEQTKKFEAFKTMDHCLKSC